MMRDELTDTIIDWVSDTFGGLPVDDTALDTLVDRLENLGMVIEP